MSTNEVFDGKRTSNVGYTEADRPAPINAYGSSKLAGEEGARTAFVRAGRSSRLMVVRTAWLYGPPGRDFPSKIIAAADALPAGESLRVVADEVSSPTYSLDLAAGLVRLLTDHAPAGTYHLVNRGHASRLEIAQRVLAHCRPNRTVAPISQRDFTRASTPPAWSALGTSAVPKNLRLRWWREAIDDYLSTICPD
jgi:dTDP-4-dehydrorhamnose reductase